MNPIEYLESVKERLATDPIIVRFDVVREFANLDEGFIRVRANLVNGDWLDFSELVRLSDTLEIINYRYQWLDKDKNHIQRWDNTPHFPHLENAPHHTHIGGQVFPASPVNIFLVLDEIASRLKG